MTKISKKAAYPVKIPVRKDYFVGTDSENNGKTVNFDFESTAKLINELNGTPILNYIFKTDNNIPLAVLTDGVFLSEGNETTVANISKLYINKKNFHEENMSDLFRFIAVNREVFVMKLRNSSNLANAVYFKITDATEFQDHFVLDVAVSISNTAVQELVNFNVYFFDFELSSSELVVALPEFNKIVTQTGFTSTGTSITFNPSWTWLIKNVNYTNPSSVTKPINPTSSGKKRIDSFVLNTSGTFQVVTGAETIGSPIQELTPIDTLYVTFCIVGDAGIESVDPIDLSAYATTVYVDGKDALKVDKVTGYSLTKNDLTDLLKASYDSAVTNAQSAWTWIATNGSNLLSHLSRTDNPHSVTKSQVGLGNVDNTSDANKPVSTAQAAADAQVLSDGKTYSDGLITQLINGAPTDANTLKELNDKILAVQAIIGGSTADGDSLVNTVAELLAVFATFPEGVDLVTLLAGKVSTTDVYNALDCIVAGKVADARQLKALNDLIVALTAVVSGKENTSNKAASTDADVTSDVKFPTILKMVNYVTGLFAKKDSPTFTGIPTAPTATLGTNTTQIATTAFVLANSNANGVLEYNTTDKTVWNNGKLNENSNTSFGEGALRTFSSGYENTAYGVSALSLLSSGSSNTGIGYNSLLNVSSGNHNTAIGDISLRSITSGSSNTGIGRNAGDRIADGSTPNALANQSTYIGSDTRALSNNGTNETVIGYLAIGSGSNTVTIGNTSVVKTVLNGALKLSEYTVATLPSITAGQTAYATVTDATAPTYLGTLTGGGSVKCPVFYDGTVWRSTIDSDSVSLTGNQTINGSKTFSGQTNIASLLVSNLAGSTSRIVSADATGQLSASSVFTHNGQISVTNSITANSFIKSGGTASQFLKADGSTDSGDVVKNIVKSGLQGSNVTGTVSETILYSQLIPANTFKDGDFMTLFSRIARPSPTSSSGGVNQRVRINTSNTLTGATQIALNNATAGVSGNQFISMQRTFNVTNGFLVGIISSQSIQLDIINSNSPQQFNVFNPTVDNYIFITGQLGFSGDTMYHVGTKITN